MTSIKKKRVISKEGKIKKQPHSPEVCLTKVLCWERSAPEPGGFPRHSRQEQGECKDSASKEGIKHSFVKPQLAEVSELSELPPRGDARSGFGLVYSKT